PRSLRIALFRLRLLPLGEGLSVTRAHDEGTILPIVELRRVRRLVAAHADGGGYLCADVGGRIRGVLAAGAVASLALHVAPTDSRAADAALAHFGPVDAADPARLLPAGDVAADAVEAELLLHRDQRLVGVGVAGLGPEVGRVLVALDARVGAGVG